MELAPTGDEGGPVKDDEERVPTTLAHEHRTVSRVVTILETVAAEPRGVRLALLCSVLEAPKSSVFSLVKGLVATGYLAEENGVYRIGPAVSALLPLGRPRLLDAAGSSMEQLRDEFDETVMLATAVGSSVVYIATVESGQMIRYSAPLRRRRPLYPTSTGKILLAHMSPRRQAAYLRERVPDAAARARVEAELAEVRRTGVAFNRGETVPDVSAAAALVRAADKPVASLAMAGPSTRIGDRLDTVAEAVRRAADTVSRRLA